MIEDDEIIWLILDISSFESEIWLVSEIISSSFTWLVVDNFITHIGKKTYIYTINSIKRNGENFLLVKVIYITTNQ